MASEPQGRRHLRRWTGLPSVHTATLGKQVERDFAENSGVKLARVVRIAAVAERPSDGTWRSSLARRVSSPSWIRRQLLREVVATLGGGKRSPPAFRFSSRSSRSIRAVHSNRLTGLAKEQIGYDARRAECSSSSSVAVAAR